MFQGNTAVVMATDMGKAMIVLSERIDKLEKQVKEIREKLNGQEKD